MVLVTERAKAVTSYFGRADWGPATLDETGSGPSLGVGIPGGKQVAITWSGITWSGMKTDNIVPHGFLEQGTPVLLDGVRVATAMAKQREWRFFFKPGRIRIEGERSEFVTPGLRVKGHLLPQRMTLADDEGKLVWSPAFSGILNMRTGPLLLVPPKVSPRAQPEHIALWLAAWLMFESAY